MRISDWSSDVCSSDLPAQPPTNDANNVAYSEFVILRTCAFLIATAPKATLLIRESEATRVAVPARSRAWSARVALPLPGAASRSEERRAGNDGVLTGRSRWTQHHYKTKRKSPKY